MPTTLAALAFLALLQEPVTQKEPEKPDFVSMVPS
jgi:hypothetical protein